MSLNLCRHSLDSHCDTDSTSLCRKFLDFSYASPADLGLRYQRVVTPVAPQVATAWTQPVFASAVSCLTLLEVSWVGVSERKRQRFSFGVLGTTTASFAAVHFVANLRQPRFNSRCCSVQHALVSAPLKEASLRWSRIAKSSQMSSNVHGGFILGRVSLLSTIPSFLGHQLRARRSSLCFRSRSLRRQDCAVQSHTCERSTAWRRCFAAADFAPETWQSARAMCTRRSLVVLRKDASSVTSAF